MRDYFTDELGNGVGGIEVNAYPKNADGTRSSTAVASVNSSSGSGMWEIVNLDTNLAPQTGVFSLRFRNPSIGQIRWREGDAQLQVGFLTGPNGNIPVNDGAVTTAKLADGSVTDQKLGNRILDQATVTTFSNTGQLGQILSWFAKILKSIKGTTNWYDNPPTTLQAAATHATSTTNPHNTTAAQAGAVANLGTAPGLKTGNDSVKGSAGSQGTVYVARDVGIVYVSNGASWIKAGVSDYADLDNKPVIAGDPILFKTFKAGATVITPTISNDTLNIVAGSGIAITGNDTTDTITISSTAGSTGTSAHTHPGTDITSQVNDSDKIEGVAGGRYPYVSSTAQAANAGAPSNGPFKMALGSVNVSFNGGIGVLSPGVTMSGVLTMLAVNGDYDAFTGHVMLKDSTSTSITLKSNPSVSQNIRVNYIIIYW